MQPLNDTHSPDLKSWVISANDGATDFPIQNLPFGVFKRAGSDEAFRAGIAIGDQILDFMAVRDVDAFGPGLASSIELLCDDSLNRFMAQGHGAWSEIRSQVSRALAEGSALEAILSDCLLDRAKRK